jgi:hypothetical protein
MRSLLIAGVTLVAAAGCDTGGEDLPSRTAQVYLAAIRHAVEAAPPTTEPGALPVVYVVGVGEASIAAGVQAEVAALLRDENDVRFADERAQAVLADEQRAPVRDQGTLVAVGEVPPDSESVTAIDVEVEVYRTDADWSKAVLTLEERADEWSITSSSLLTE